MAVVRVSVPLDEEVAAAARAAADAAGVSLPAWLARAAADAAGLTGPPRSGDRGTGSGPAATGGTSAGGSAAAGVTDGAFADGALTDGAFTGEAATEAFTEEERRWAEAVLDSHGVHRNR